MVATDRSDEIQFEFKEQLDDENTVGLVDAEPGSCTVVFEEVHSKFHSVGEQRWNNEYFVGDEESTIFLRSDGGEFSVGYGPEFAPIEAAVKVWQYEMATKAISGKFAPWYAGYDVWLDDAGIVVFDGKEGQAAVAPTIYPWDKPHTECAPSAPGGPRI